MLVTKNEQRLWWRDLDDGQNCRPGHWERRSGYSRKSAGGGVNAEDLDASDPGDIKILAKESETMEMPLIAKGEPESGVSTPVVELMLVARDCAV